VPAVFISYSRIDKPFVEHLHGALTKREYDVWVDWEDIPPSAEWFGEIQAGVDGADGFIYVISPDSVSSTVCARELHHAVERGKRIVPVLHREPGGAEVPPEAAARNWIFLREHDDFNAGFELLVAAVETDLDYVRTHTRLGVEAARWDATGRDSSMLLRGSELSEAEAWLVAVGDKQPQPTQLQREFVLAGRQAAARRQRTVFGAISVALVIAIVLAVVALIQRSTAIHERNVAYSRQLDANAQNQANRDPELSVLLATRAAQVAPGAPTEQALRQALAESHVRQTFALDQNAAGDALWSPDSDRLLVTNLGTWARIYRPGGAAPLLTLETAPAAPGQSGWDARGDRLVIGGDRPTVYEAATGAIIGRLPGVGLHTALSSDGTRLATVDLKDIGHVYDVASGRELARFHPPYSGGVTCFAWAPDDSVIAQCDVKTFNVANPPAQVDTWDPRTGRLLHSAHSGELIGTVAFSPDSRRYVYTTTASTSGRGAKALEASIAQPGTFVYDTRTGARVISFPEAASAASFSPDGSRLAYATIGDNLGHVYEFDNGLAHVLIGQPSTIDAINFNRAGTYAVTAGDDGTARVYDASNGNLLEVLAGHKARIRSATFGLKDTEIATTSYDGTTRLWTTPDPRPSLTLLGRDEAATIGFTADGSKIVEAERSGQGRILSARDLHLVTAFRAPLGDGFAGASASHDGSLIATLVGPQRGAFAYPVAAATYDVRGGGTLARMSPSTKRAAPISGALDPAGDRLLTAGANGSADEWDPRTGRHLSTLAGTGIIGALAYTSDGRALAILHLPRIPTSMAVNTQLGDATVEIWDARSGRHLRSLDTRTALQPQIPGTTDFSGQAMAFSPDGRQLALVGVDSHVELYLTSSGRQIGLLNPEGKFAASVAFSPDGKLLAIGTAASAYVWRLPSPSPLPEFHHADGSTYGFVTGGTGVYVGFTKDSRVLMTVGDFALEAWSPSDGTQLFKAFAVRGSLSPDGSQFVGTTINGVSTYPCDLCGGLSQLLAVAKRNTTRNFTTTERATYLTAG
jgi:WD40 repeat protein